MVNCEVVVKLHLQPPVEGSGNGDASGGLDAAGGDGGDQVVQLLPLLLQLLHQGLDGPLGEGLALAALQATFSSSFKAIWLGQKRAIFGGFWLDILPVCGT